MISYITGAILPLVALCMTGMVVDLTKQTEVTEVEPQVIEKEVIKEVPVEVEKIVEVPKEVIKEVVKEVPVEKPEKEQIII